MPNRAELRSVAGPNRFICLTEDNGLVSAATFEGATISDDLSVAFDTQVLDHTAAQGMGSPQTCIPMTRSISARLQAKNRTSDLGIELAAHKGDGDGDPDQSSRIGRCNM